MIQSKSGLATDNVRGVDGHDEERCYLENDHIIASSLETKVLLIEVYGRLTHTLFMEMLIGSFLANAQGSFGGVTLRDELYESHRIEVC